MGDAGALDDLDLDDMFNDDGDALFEGLDIELEMGDIISNEKKEKAPGTALPPSAARRAGGPRTKKTNPMLEKAIEEGGDASNRRKTKRKSKAPSIFDDEDFIDEQPKKKRKAALKAKKATEPIVKSKRKKKSEGAIPTPSTTHAQPSLIPKAKSIGPTSSVAAAGQFGGRVKRGSSSSLGSSKAKRKMKKAGETENDAPGIAGISKPDSIKPPKPEPTYGGLGPSKTLFYPFLESVPPEPSMQKRKAYPILDRINSALTSQIATSSSVTAQEVNKGGVKEDSAVAKLMLETYEASEKDKAAFTSEKRTALLKGIPELRALIQGVDKTRLVKDVFSMCWLLTRQYNFVKQSLDNMKSWCREQFNEEDYKTTYDPPVEKPKHNKWKSPFVKLKVSFSGYKEPKGSPPLLGFLPPIVLDPSASRPSLASNAAATAASAAYTESKLKAADSKKPFAAAAKASTTSKAKKKKEKATDKSKLRTSPAVAAAAVPTPVPRTYANSLPQVRRQLIMEKVAQLALELENAQQIEYSVGRLQEVPEEDPPLHTNRMWEFLQTAGFYKSPPVKRLALKSPEIHPRGVFLPVPARIKGRENMEGKVSSNSLYDRLQSLLVEEDDVEEMNDSDDGSDSEYSLEFLDDEDEDDYHNLDENDKNSAERYLDLADLSALATEERTFIHLSSVGLIRKSLFPMVELEVSNDEKDDESGEDDLVNVIGKMSADLSSLTTANNSRISYLESAIEDSELHRNEHSEEEQAALIAKCQNLLKRSKEKAKKAKQKKDDSLNLPW